MKFKVGDKVKINFKKVKENIETKGIIADLVFNKEEMLLISNEDNVFTVSKVFNVKEENYPFRLTFNGVATFYFRSNELILVEKAED